MAGKAEPSVPITLLTNFQAYIALRGLSDVAIRADIDPQGGIGARLPNLHLPKSDSAAFVLENTGVTKISDGKSYLVAAQYIPSWVDAKLKQNSLDDSLEGYQDEAAKDESREWVSLLEKDVHTALVRPLLLWCSFLVLRSLGPFPTYPRLVDLRRVVPDGQTCCGKESRTQGVSGAAAWAQDTGASIVFKSERQGNRDQVLGGYTRTF